MAELTEEKVQEMIQQSERTLSRRMEDIQVLLEKGARSDKYQADTLDLILRQQKTLLTAFSEMPQGIRQLLSTSISKIVQDEVTKALAVQIPKIIEAVQQQSGGMTPSEEPKQSEQPSLSVQQNTSEKPAGERYADDEVVTREAPKGFKMRLLGIQQAVNMGATTKEALFQTESGEIWKTDKSLMRVDEHKDGSAAYDVITEDAVAHGQMEGKEKVKETTYREGVFSHKIIGHRANIIDKLDEEGRTLDEKKELVREYRQKHPKNGGR